MLVVKSTIILAQTSNSGLPELPSDITPYSFVFNYEGKSPEITITDYSDNHTQMIALLDRLKACSETIREVRVTAYSSIAGIWYDNDELTRRRAENFRHKLSVESGYPEHRIVTNRVAEDWDGLVAFVDNDARMPKAGYVNEIILTTGIFAGREAKLMLLDSGHPYRYMKENYFPRLERVEVVIYCGKE
jgi:hypothetical protein